MHALAVYYCNSNKNDNVMHYAVIYYQCENYINMKNPIKQRVLTLYK